MSIKNLKYKETTSILIENQFEEIPLIKFLKEFQEKENNQMSSFSSSGDDTHISKFI